MNLLPSNFFGDEMFDGMFGRRNEMQCDIYEQNNEYVIEMDIPGFNKDDINIDVNHGYLTVTAEKMSSSDNRNYIRQERRYGKYQRSFYFGNLNDNNIKAKFNNGILKITIPKQEVHDNNKSIEIE